MEHDPKVLAFIQARMSSARFPGKVLAPLAGKPVISHVIERVSEAIAPERIVVATSVHPSDDPLAGYVAHLGIRVFRGPLENVFARFQQCLRQYPGEWFFRISADSPLLDPTLFGRMLEYRKREDIDLVTNVFPRSFPKGRSLEMIAAKTFVAIDPYTPSLEEQEHVTPVYYRNPDRYRILNIESGDPTLAAMSLAVDTLEDLERLEALLRRGAEGRASLPMTDSERQL